MGNLKFKEIININTRDKEEHRTNRIKEIDTKHTIYGKYNNMKCNVVVRLENIPTNRWMIILKESMKEVVKLNSANPNIKKTNKYTLKPQSIIYDANKPELFNLVIYKIKPDDVQGFIDNCLNPAITICNKKALKWSYGVSGKHELRRQRLSSQRNILSEVSV